MESSYEVAEWVFATISSQSIESNQIFNALWRPGGMRPRDSEYRATWLDQFNSKLIATGIENKKQALFILPNRNPDRTALLFATALVLHAVGNVFQTKYRRVLYFGSSIGVRDHLASIQIGNLELSSVFPQSRVKKDYEKQSLKASRRKSDKSKNSLPEVICVYSPADVGEIYNRYTPDWIAVDCEDVNRLSWIKEVVNVSRDNNIPLMAWIQNPLSEVVSQFQDTGALIFPWQANDSIDIASNLPVSVDNLSDSFNREINLQIKPIILEDPGSSKFQESLFFAYVALAKSTALANRANRYQRETLKIGWKYLRALETMPIPIDLYESEAKSLWGLSSLAGLSAALQRFLEDQSGLPPEMLQVLDESQRLLLEAHEEIGVVLPPYWLALCHLCFDNDKLPKVLIFPTKASKELFIFGLLAYRNVTVDDLQDLDVWLTSLSEIYPLLTLERSLESSDPLERNLERLKSGSLVYVGIPSSYANSKLDPFLREDLFRPLIFPYQINTLAKRIKEWDERLFPDISEWIGPISNLVNSEYPSVEKVYIAKNHITLGQGRRLEIARDNVGKLADKTDQYLWENRDPIEEISTLVMIDYDQNEAEERESESAEDALNTHLVDLDQSDDVELVERALEINLSGGWQIFLQEDDKVRVFSANSKSGPSLDERYARSLRPDDRAVFLQGRHYQNLYDLIISRVHNKPGVHLHVKLIQRWREDFARAYRLQNRSLGNWSPNDLLIAIQALGSNITTTQTINNWVQGETIAPEDPNDLRRLGEVLKIQFVFNEYRRIDRAARRLRAIHRGLGNRLKNWIISQIEETEFDWRENEEILDRELGLTFSDFKESIQILTVRSVEERHGLFLVSELGKLEKVNDNG